MDLGQKQPKPLPRPRFSRRHGRVFPDPNIIREKDRIGWAYLQGMKKLGLPSMHPAGPSWCSWISSIRPRPRWQKKLMGEWRVCVPDIDNLAKLSPGRFKRGGLGGRQPDRSDEYDQELRPGRGNKDPYHSARLAEIRSQLVRSFNEHQVYGQLARAPEQFETPKGKKAAVLTIGTEETWNDQTGKERRKVDWHRAVRLRQRC